MKRHALLLWLLIATSFSTYAQHLHSIKGRTVDTASTTLLTGTSIAVLNAKDSTLVKFTRSAQNGTFEINGIKNGKFILLVSYPKYADFVDHFTLDSTQQIKDYTKINLTGMATILNDVIIKGNRAAIKIKGDTTEFDPKAFNIEPNAKVEDLIKQFPGFQVDKDGKITAQGQNVPKVLVDGEEFFGDDPTLVTKNLRADMVESVQLYDKTSDQAAFTGIDDGEKTKTLNIKLKEDKKNGYFGKVQAGAGTDDYYQGQAMFNKFWGKKKFSAYGIAGNNGKIGLGWEDGNKYGSNAAPEVTDDGGIYFTGSGDDFDSFSGQYNGQGIPVARTGGLHFDNKWNKDKESLNTNYKIGSIRVTGDRTTLNQNNLTSGTINTNSGQTFDNDMFRQKMDATYQIKLDTTTTLKVSVDGTLKNSDTENIFTSEGRDQRDSLLNTGNRNLTNSTDEQIFNVSALLTKRLKKKGRTVSLSLSQNVNTNKSEGYLNSTNEFFDTTGALDSTVLVNQYKVNNIRNSTFKSNLAYTEPLSKSLSVVVNYGLSFINGTSDRKSFNQSAQNVYDVFDPLFSNNYKLEQTLNQGGAVFNYLKGKVTANMGSKFSAVKFNQDDLYNNIRYSRNFINYMPQASFTYRFSQQKSFRFNYNGNSSQPTLDQIQPVRINTDPLNITLGNPDLKPSFRSSFNARYSSYKVLTDQSIYISAYYSFTSNPIASDINTTAAGVSTNRFVNLSGSTPFNYNFYGGFSRKIFGVSTGFDLSANSNTSFNYINGVLNKTESSTYNLSANLYKYIEKKFNASASFGPTYNATKASVQESLNSNGWGWRGSFYTTVHLPGKIDLNSDGEYQFTGATQTFSENFERFVWNAGISKKFLKSDNLVVSASMNDLLNQNIGFNRSAYNGNITQTSYTTIRRYFMLSVSWDFTKMGGAVKK
ncbi:outer membrane beta-barrel protein [Pedobacter sp. AW1-32]|uniref:outer membrane beta-barrel protein n=1 Tax=Pedobacter sp. AW1-32 TaxID=3383026 RepID=UPI003FEF5F82